MLQMLPIFIFMVMRRCLLKSFQYNSSLFASIVVGYLCLHFHFLEAVSLCVMCNQHVIHITCFCSVGAPRVVGLKVKCFKISAFKSSAQHDDSGSRGRGSKVAKNSVELSYLPKDGEETTAESPKAHNVPLSYATETDETVAASPAIHKLFKKWLTMLRTQSPNEVVDEVLGEGRPPVKMSEAQTETQITGRGEILKAVWCHFWCLDATIKIPLLIL